ncbi:MAG: putative glutamate--cysteine ligase 2 [Gemmatales bacterium]|nr:MAG: putative glutamate--cysteine ligase 2 [Gemmatales bacterium]
MAKNKMVFRSSEKPTIGVEIEVALVDAKTMELKSAVLDILPRVPERLKHRIKPELMQCYLEVNTEVCNTVDDAEADLREKFTVVEHIADELGLRLYWSGTHPFSVWEEQKVTPNERYERLLEILQDVGRRLVTFGLHVHVGVDSGDKAVMICDRITRHLPTLLALSCNSPWWNRRVSGLQSHRSKIMESLPTAGLPDSLRNWSEYAWIVNHLVETGFIHSIRDIWWDVRPHDNFGTVEIRVCDVPGTLDDCLAITALIQCLVQALSDQIDEGTYQRDYHPMMVRQNKWRATRYGLDAKLVDTETFTMRPAREVARRLAELLRPMADQLNCRRHLERIMGMCQQPTWAERQLQILKETNDVREVVRRMTELSRISKPAK